MAFRNLPIISRIYIVVLSLFAIAAAVYSVFKFPLVRPIDLSLLIYILLIFATARLNVLIPYARVAFSIDTAFVFTILMIYGPLPAMLADVLGKLILSVAHFKKNFFKIPLNASSGIVSVFAGYLAFHSFLFGASGTSTSLVLPIFGMMCAYFLVNTFTIAIAICLSEKSPLLPFWAKNFLPTSIGYLIAGSAATLIFILDQRGGTLGFVVVVPVLILFYFFQRMYLQKEKDDQKHIHQLEQVNQELKDQIKERRKAQKALSYRVELEHLLNLVSAEFINLPTSEWQRGFTFALETVGDFASYDRGFIALPPLKKGEDTLVNYWVHPKAANVQSQKWHADIFDLPWLSQKLRQASSVQAVTPEDLPSDAVKEIEILKAANVQSLVCIPITYAGQLTGVLGFETLGCPREFPDEEVGLFQTLSKVLANVTEHRRIEAEKVALENQLAQAHKMEAIGRLAGGVAHDFNNLLTGIIGHIDLALLETKGSAGDYLKKAFTASKRAKGVAAQLLAFSRKSRVKRARVDPGEIAQEVIDIFAETIDRRILVNNQCPKGEFHIYADPVQFSQVVLNLCINARDAVLENLDQSGSAPAGDPMRIDLSLEPAIIGQDVRHSDHDDWEARPGNYIVLNVSDNGIGIPAENMKQIFEPFFSTKEPGHGTGLGLAMVFGLVKQHNGWLNVYSDKGQGSTFKVYFPEFISDEPELEAEIVEQKLKGGSETILLVDDELVIRELGQAILERFGYTVLLAVDGEQALTVYNQEKGRIQLIILDVSMPKLSGLETLERIRKDNSQVKVLMSSGYAGSELSDGLNRMEYSGFISKPYMIDDLIKKVRSVFDEN